MDKQSGGDFVARFNQTKCGWGCLCDVCWLAEGPVEEQQRDDARRAFRTSELAAYELLLRLAYGDLSDDVPVDLGEPLARHRAGAGHRPACAPSRSEIERCCGDPAFHQTVSPAAHVVEHVTDLDPGDVPGAPGPDSAEY